MEALDAKDAAADAGASTGPPTPSAIGALVIFLVSVACVIALVLLPVKLRVPVPRRLRAARNGGGSSSGGVRASVAVRIPHWLPPPLGVLVMLAAGCLDSRGLLNGILGDSSIQPYSILILFLALAYIAAALDQTGAFAWLALKMTGRAATTGPRLFVLQSLLAAVVTLFTR
ncbi:hypothetical protein MNEG_5353 [Monoraphidium neglectum]|uniref:Citrate transporter-like domain-containing protein n=1 Tax=Monoraphidium neglectum TaxID=145388 RepID=A0A0D2L6T5_9CHLO|nr:hypothetical protein MNEG_5353 [Monoraphidium neglectum]KIZ02604.1 hypothetical protein MNEG_5353 [Monoraphidium neglectum]|eukprot:XP_013901623.1 hypothetical protein MNEG_5353 [Monoraphidium neglectum]